MEMTDEAPFYWPWLLVTFCVFLIGITLAGCTLHSKELAFCREYVPKCEQAIESCGEVLGRQRATLDSDKVQIGLCNDLNRVLMENNVPSEAKSKKKYFSRSKHLEKS